MTVVQPCVSHPSSRALPDEQSEWLQVPWGGSFPLVGGGCEPAHWPFEQVSFVLQAIPQPPQLFGSVSVSTQSEPHIVLVHVVGGGWLEPPSGSDCGGFDDEPPCVDPPSPFFAMTPLPPEVPTAHAATNDRAMRELMILMAAGSLPRTGDRFNALP